MKYIRFNFANYINIENVKEISFGVSQDSIYFYVEDTDNPIEQRLDPQFKAIFNPMQARKKLNEAISRFIVNDEKILFLDEEIAKGDFR